MSKPEDAGEQPVFPDLDFLTHPETRYDPEVIAERSLWPLVNAKWEGDFRREGEPNMRPYSKSLAGFYEGAWYEVTLEAETRTDEWLPEDGESKTRVKILVHKVSLFVEELKPYEVGNMVDLAIRENSEPVMEMLKEDDEGISREHEIRAYEGIFYVFDSDGDCHIEPYLVLKDKHKNELWARTARQQVEDDDDIDGPDGEAEVDDEVSGLAEPLRDVEFFEADVDKLIAAVTVLRGEQSIVKYLREIKKYPESQ